MAVHRFDTMTVLATRPRDAVNRIVETLGRVDCTACAKCCTDKAELAIARHDPSAAVLFARIKSSVPPDATKDFGNSIRVFPRADGTCHFLTARRCQTYDSRPVVCRLFPFSLIPALDASSHVDIAVLSSHCPPLKQLKDRDVRFLYLSDILLSASDVLSEPSGYPQSVVMLAALARMQGEDNISTSRLLYYSLEGLRELLKLSSQAASQTGIPSIILSDPSNNIPFFPIW
jgi:Fe-S-cluster containining protein